MWQAKNEVRVLAALDHPNVVKYYETFVEEKTGRLQIVMEYCDVSPLEASTLHMAACCLNNLSMHKHSLLRASITKSDGARIFACYRLISISTGNQGLTLQTRQQAGYRCVCLVSPHCMKSALVESAIKSSRVGCWWLQITGKALNLDC